MPINIQHANVGNKGDILKHAALLQLAKWFDSHVTGDRAWLDTHCYLLESSLANRHWQQEVELLINEYPAYEAYHKLEQDYIARGKYRCSSGLVLDMIPAIKLLLSECDPVTRNTLQQQLQAESAADVVLIDDMHDWQSMAELPMVDGLLALLDPFRLDDAGWNSSCAAIEKILRPDGIGILIVFTYERVAGFQEWRLAPTGWSGPVAVIDHKPYHLAVYTTKGYRQELVKLLTIHGWLSFSDNDS